MTVELRAFPAVRVAYLRYTGPYGGMGIPQTWGVFAEWCNGRGFFNPRRRTYGLSLDDPKATPVEKCRYDCCIEVDDAFTPEGEIGVQLFAGGLYACALFTGRPPEMPPVWDSLRNDWLPKSGFVLDQRAPMELYDTDYKMDPATGSFTALVCIPVRRPDA